LRKGLFSGIVLTVMLVGSLILAYKIVPVISAGTIYIRADGSIDPPTSPITTFDKITYVLSSNVSGSVVVQRNSITIDGEGYTLQGSGDGMGLTISSVNGVTLRNTCINGFGYGVYMQASQYNVISGNNMTTNKYAGIYLYYSYNNNVTRNKLSDSGTSSFGAIRLDCANYNNIIGNNITSNSYGIYFYDSLSNHIFHNNLLNNAHNAYGAWDLSYASPGNMWNDGYPFGGNHWDDYNGMDFCSGLFQNETGSDGIGDTPQPIHVDDFSQDFPSVLYELDNCPLMNTWTPYDNGTICIKADGSVEPSGAPIQRKGDLYTLYDGIDSDPDGIIVERDNITLDGRAQEIQGGGNGNGITLNGRKNVSVLNMEVDGFPCGINIQGSSYVKIIGNNVTASSGYGIYLSGGEASILSNNTITESGKSDIELYSTSNNSVAYNILTKALCGISLENGNNNLVLNNNLTSNGNGLTLVLSSSNKVTENVVENNTRGVDLQLSPSNVLIGNMMIGNVYNFGVSGESLNDFMNSVDTTNLVDGKPVFYILNQSDVVANSEAGYWGFINCRNITVEGLTLANNINSLLVAYTSNSRIIANNVTKNQFGICFSSSSSNVVIGNTVSSNDYGVCFNQSSNNSICDNDIANNRYGIFLSGSSKNDIARNNITSNYVSMYFSASPGNLIYHNNLIGNIGGPCASSDCPNVWDNGYPSGGNYWSDQLGNDSWSGPCQNETGRDGIGDVPYTIIANNTDSYPLMQAWTPPEIEVTNLTTSKTVFGRGYAGTVTVTFENRGNKIEAFNATVYSNSTLIHSEQVVIRMTDQALSFDWNTTGFVYGNYTLWAYAKPDPAETNTANDNVICSNLTVTIPGDLNGDFSVDVYDAISLAGSYSLKPGSPNWNPNTDINNDSVVDIYDALILSKYYGQRYP
jgi:parallel beta-helix repeat protein